MAGLAALTAAIRAKLTPNPPNISTIMRRIARLLDDSITGITVRDAGPPAIDLSKINLPALAKRIKDSKHKNTDLEALKAAIRAKLGTLLRLNRTRADYAEQFEALIDGGEESCAGTADEAQGFAGAQLEAQSGGAFFIAVGD